MFKNEPLTSRSAPVRPLHSPQARLFGLPELSLPCPQTSPPFVASILRQPFLQRLQDIGSGVSKFPVESLEEISPILTSTLLVNTILVLPQIHSRNFINFIPYVRPPSDQRDRYFLRTGDPTLGSCPQAHPILPQWRG